MNHPSIPPFEAAPWKPSLARCLKKEPGDLLLEVPDHAALHAPLPCTGKELDEVKRGFVHPSNPTPLNSPMGYRAFIRWWESKVAAHHALSKGPRYLTSPLHDGDLSSPAPVGAEAWALVAQTRVVAMIATTDGDYVLLDYNTGLVWQADDAGRVWWTAFHDVPGLVDRLRSHTSDVIRRWVADLYPIGADLPPEGVGPLDDDLFNLPGGSW